MESGKGTDIEKQLGRRDFLTLAGAGATAFLVGEAYAEKRTPPTSKPNVVVIVADDLGYADIGVHGCKDIPTPHIDSIAQRGVRFTNGYVSCPVCSPTRAGLMTGRYQQRFGYYYNPGPAQTVSPQIGLPLSETTLPDAMKQAGYATGMVGKWHLGLAPEFHPMKRGFDQFFGFLHGGHSYVAPREDKLNLILRGTEPVDEEAYLTDAFTREAVAFIEQQESNPFFLYLSYNAVHTPMQAPPKYRDRFPDIADPKRRTYAGMLAAMDDGIGEVLAALRDKGVETNTLVLFIGDNGGPPPANASSNAPFKGGKASIWEGGIRVPFLMQWPRRIPQGKLYDHPVISLDILPTSLAAAGGPLPSNLDGVDLIPYLTEWKRRRPHKYLFWKWHRGSVVRKDEWKLARSNDGLVDLYDLSKDIGEMTDISEDHPRLVRKLTTALDKWESELKPPLWQTPQARQRGRRRGRRP